MWRAKSMNPLAVLAVATAICTAAVRAEDLDASHLLGAWVLEANQPIGCGETWICAGLLVISEHRVSWLSRAATPECSADYRVTKQYVGPSFPGGRMDNTADYIHFDLALEPTDCVARTGPFGSLIVSFAHGRYRSAHFAEFNTGNAVQGWGVMRRVVITD